MGSRADAPRRSVDVLFAAARTAAPRSRAAGGPCGRTRAVAGPRVGQHAGRPHRNGISQQSRTGKADRGSGISERLRGRARRRDREVPRFVANRSGAVRSKLRRILTIIALALVIALLGWG